MTREYESWASKVNCEYKILENMGTGWETNVKKLGINVKRLTINFVIVKN